MVKFICANNWLRALSLQGDPGATVEIKEFSERGALRPQHVLGDKNEVPTFQSKVFKNV